MKIMWVANGPANAAERDPVARREVPLFARLIAQGAAASVVLLGDRGGLGSEFARAGIPVETLPVPLHPRPASLLHLPEVVLRLRALLRRHDPDVLEGDEPLPTIAVGLAARGRRRGVVVYRRHHQTGRRQLVAASRLAARLSDRTIVSCESMRRQALSDDGTPLERIEVAVSGTADIGPPSPHERTALRARLAVPADARVVVAVSRLRHEKGIDVLIDALDRMDGARAVHLVVVGIGPEEEALRDAASRCRVPVHFVGHCADVRPWLGLADVVAMPSRREAFGRVTLEAMAAGRPIVASRVGGLGDAVRDGETGLLVPPENPAALADALLAVLDDAPRAHAMGRAGRLQYETRYTIDHMATALRAAWGRAVSEERRAS